MTALGRVIGVDPGPVPGFVVLDYAGSELEHVDVAQCSVGLAPRLFVSLLADDRQNLVGIEQWVSRGRSGRSSTSRAGQATRDLIGRLVQAAPFALVSPADWYARSAGQVKPWATDARLDVAGLLEATKGMRHARDAARHALFTAVHDGGVPDPLSKKGSESA